MIHYDCVLCLANNALIDQEVVSELSCTAICNGQCNLQHWLLEATSLLADESTRAADPPAGGGCAESALYHFRMLPGCLMRPLKCAANSLVLAST